MNSVNMAMDGRRQARGFTLVELLVTIAVLTILISIGIPMFGSFTKGSAITSRTSDLVAAINLTRAEAVGRRAAVQLTPIGGSWSRGWQVSLVTGGTVLQVVDYGDRQQDVGITAGSSLTAISFDLQGRLATTPANITPTYTICPTGGGVQGRSLSMNMFGRVTVTTVSC